MRGNDYIRNVTECIEKAWSTQEEKIRFFLGGYGGFDRFAAACAPTG